MISYINFVLTYDSQNVQAIYIYFRFKNVDIYVDISVNITWYRIWISVDICIHQLLTQSETMGVGNTKEHDSLKLCLYPTNLDMLYDNE